ncbi:MAG: DUF126 domain-containing protein [Thermoproteota archaeon]
MRAYLLRGHVDGEAEGELVVIQGRLSFYGEVDRETGCLNDGRCLEGKILVAEGSRGSTVGSYIIYGLARRGKGPSGIVVAQPDPILVAGAVMGAVPLASGLPKDALRELRDGCRASLAVRSPKAILRVKCG